MDVHDAAREESEKQKGSQACKRLGDFVKKVQDESKKKKSSLTPAQASVLLDAAARLAATLGC